MKKNLKRNFNHNAVNAALCLYSFLLCLRQQHAYVTRRELNTGRCRSSHIVCCKECIWTVTNLLNSTLYTHQSCDCSIKCACEFGQSELHEMFCFQEMFARFNVFFPTRFLLFMCMLSTFLFFFMINCHRIPFCNERVTRDYLLDLIRISWVTIFFKRF